MEEHHLKYPAFILSDVFLKIRSQLMISFDRKGITKFLSRDVTRRNHLPQQLKHTVKEGLALKLKCLSFIKSSPILGNFTRYNFVKFNHAMLKRVVCISLVVLFALPLAAQDNMGEAASADSLYEFRFKSGNDRSFGVSKENEAQLKAPFEFVDCHRPAIEVGTMPLYVDGYCRSMGTDEENLRTAKIRASRVKSGTAETAVATATDATAVPVSCDDNGIPELTLRANLLRWATLTPDLGVEWRVSRNIGILVNGTWTSWSWDNKNRRYALWRVSPEVRYYISKEKRGYLGAMYHIGEFNYKLGDIGKQGNYQGGGITGGYQLPLNYSFSLDFHAALGYTYADYDKYNVTDGVRVRTESGVKKNYWGINQLGVTLMWKFLK